MSRAKANKTDIQFMVTKDGEKITPSSGFIFEETLDRLEIKAWRVIEEIMDEEFNPRRLEAAKLVVGRKRGLNPDNQQLTQAMDSLTKVLNDIKQNEIPAIPSETVSIEVTEDDIDGFKGYLDE